MRTIINASEKVYLVIPYAGYEDTLWGRVRVFNDLLSAKDYARDEENETKGVRCQIREEFIQENPDYIIEGKKLEWRDKE